MKPSNRPSRVNNATHPAPPAPGRYVVVTTKTDSCTVVAFGSYAERKEAEQVARMLRWAGCPAQVFGRDDHGPKP